MFKPLLLSCVVLVSTGWAAGKQPVDAGAPNETLSETTRQLLRRRMARHGRDLTTLVQAAVLLKHTVVADLAKNIADEPRLVRPVTGNSDELNSALPETFFVLQDELRAKAKDLALGATQKNNTAMGESLAAMTRTCMACHSAFLSP